MKNVLDGKLANQFASSTTPEGQALREQYNKLDLSARAGAEKVSGCCKTVREEWKKLLPILDQMQALLSERGVDHASLAAAGLPTWTTWLERFLKESELDVTMRAVQKQLAKLRGAGKPKAEPSDTPMKLSAWDQKRLIKAAACGNELVEALEAGGDYRPLMQEYKDIGMDAKKIDHILNAFSVESVAPAKAVALPPSQDAGNTVVLAAPSTSARPRVALPNCGSSNGLANYVTGNCDDGFKAAFAGLRPVEMASCLQEFVRTLACKYYPSDRNGWEIKVQYVAAGPPPTQRAA